MGAGAAGIIGPHLTFIGHDPGRAAARASRPAPGGDVTEPYMSSLEELQQLIHKKYGIEPSQLDPDKPMLEAGIDSLALVEFLFEVEEKFKVSLEGYPDPVGAGAGHRRAARRTGRLKAGWPSSSPAWACSRPMAKTRRR
jgi:acyl carrier protein